MTRTSIWHLFRSVVNCERSKLASHQLEHARDMDPCGARPVDCIELLAAHLRRKGCNAASCSQVPTSCRVPTTTTDQLHATVMWSCDWIDVVESPKTRVPNSSPFSWHSMMNRSFLIPSELHNLLTHVRVPLFQAPAFALSLPLGGYEQIPSCLYPNPNTYYPLLTLLNSIYTQWIIIFY
jgi:hypothetical protein